MKTALEWVRSLEDTCSHSFIGGGKFNCSICSEDAIAAAMSEAHAAGFAAGVAESADLVGMVARPAFDIDWPRDIEREIRALAAQSGKGDE